MIRFALIPTLTATIMWATAGTVNAEGVTFTETISSAQAKRGTSLKDLVTELDVRGASNTLMAGIGPQIGLEDKVAIKMLSLRPNPSKWVKRYCDLTYAVTNPDLPPHPHCFVLIDKKKSGRDVRYVYFRFDLTGRLLTAGETLGKDDEGGKPIRGTAQENKLDITDPKVKKEADDLMDFWRLGRYKKYLPKKAPTSKSAP